MKREFSLLILTGLCATLLPINAIASQEIDFRDLAKAGPAVTKRYTVDGVRSEGEQHILRFSESDNVRLEEYRSRAQSSNNVSAPSPVTNTPAKSSGKTFVCIVYCKSGTGPVVRQEVRANNRSEAARWMGENSDKVCQAQGQKYSSNIRFDEKQCSEK